MYEKHFEMSGSLLGQTGFAARRPCERGIKVVVCGFEIEAK
jgi:hypothetical protein